MDPSHPKALRGLGLALGVRRLAQHPQGAVRRLAAAQPEGGARLPRWGEIRGENVETHGETMGEIMGKLGFYTFFFTMKTGKSYENQGFHHETTSENIKAWGEAWKKGRCVATS